MKIEEARFEISAAAPAQYPAAGAPEVVFAGRSNVGKSSLLNSLTRAKNLARVSATPGKTRLINFFLVGGEARFVDLPGYGFAQTSAAAREEWRKNIDAYFSAGRPIALVILLVDARHPLQESDARTVEWLGRFEIPIQVVLTKIDKLNRSVRSRQLPLLAASLAKAGWSGDPLAYSSLTGEGRRDLLRTIENAVGAFETPV